MINQLADVSGLLRFFHDRFDAKNATDDELEFLAFATEEASASASELSALLSNIANVVSEDEEKGNCGSFRGQGDVPRLLWMISNRLREIEVAALIGSEGEFKLRERYRTRAEALAKREGASALSIAAHAVASRSTPPKAVRKDEQEVQNA